MPETPSLKCRLQIPAACMLHKRSVNSSSTCTSSATSAMRLAFAPFAKSAGTEANRKSRSCGRPDFDTTSGSGAIINSASTTYLSACLPARSASRVDVALLCTYLPHTRRCNAMDIDSAAGPEEFRSAARSCTTCSKAKAKCVRDDSRRICVRSVTPRISLSQSSAHLQSKRTAN